MNVVFIVPTGIGCEIGGHAGDASPAAKLIAACCDKFITHPNVFNASDINEMPENTLYVEGSALDRFLKEEINLKEVRRNKVLVAANRPVKNDIVNAVSAARATIGLEAEIIEIYPPLILRGGRNENGATGEMEGAANLVEQIRKLRFDALAVATPIEVDRHTKLDYYRHGGVNPWGYVEAMCSRYLSKALDKPVAHSPSEEIDPKDTELYNFNEVVDPRIAAEMVSITYLHCILKGLHHAPRFADWRGDDFSARDIDFLVSPENCNGPAHDSCFARNTSIIYVADNMPSVPMTKNTIIYDEIHVNNYLEAAGVIMAEKAGVHMSSVLRPLSPTLVR